MKKILAIALVVIMLFAFAACGGKTGTDAVEKKTYANITVGTGGSQGTYFAFTTAVGGILETSDYSFKVITTGGSQDNIELIQDGDAQMAIVQNDVMNYAYEGTNGFTESIKDFSVIGCVYLEVCQLVARKDSGIKSVADLKGKTVAVGDVGSGVYYNATQILEAAGLDIDKDINKVAASFGDSATQLKDGSIDAAFVTAGTPTTAITELSLSTDVVLIDLGADVISALTEKYTFYIPYEATNKDYAFIGADEKVNTVAIKATYVVTNTMSDDQAYQITKDLWEKQTEIAAAHAKGNEMDCKEAVNGLGVVPLHPGAERYYKEVGVIA